MTSGHDATVESALRTIGSIEGGRGSGSAAALALSAAIECLRLYDVLADRESGKSPGGRDPDPAEWARRARASFDDDPAAFAAVLEVRRARKKGGDAADLPALARREIEALSEANTELLRLGDLAADIAEGAVLRRNDPGPGYAKAEVEVAHILGRAVIEAVGEMLAANVRDQSALAGTHDLDVVGLSAIRDFATRHAIEKSLAAALATVG